MPKSTIRSWIVQVIHYACPWARICALMFRRLTHGSVHSHETGHRLRVNTQRWGLLRHRGGHCLTILPSCCQWALLQSLRPGKQEPCQNEGLVLHTLFPTLTPTS